jgi:hypothetical protein
MTDERWDMIELLRDSGAAFADRVAGLDETQWLASPSPGEWSPAAIAEHVTLVEVSTGKLIARKLFAEPASDADLASARQKEARLLARAASREDKLTAPDFVSPTGRWPDRSDLLATFQTHREMVVVQLSDPTRDLRRFAAPHPLLGPLDGWQWGMFLGLHLKRHLDQLEETLARRPA